MSIEISASITAVPNLGVSTLGAITVALRHYRLGNIHFCLFLILGLTGAAGAFMGSILTGFVSVSYLLRVIGIIVLYESYMNRIRCLKAQEQNKRTLTGRKLSKYYTK